MQKDLIYDIGMHNGENTEYYLKRGFRVIAVEANPTEDGLLYALRALGKTSDRTQSQSPFEVENATKFYPKIVTARIRAQEGLFITCPNLEAPLDHVLPARWRIEIVSIPAERKNHLRYELFRLGIHQSSLFPDLDGLAARIRWQHTVSSPFDDDPTSS